MSTTRHKPEEYQWIRRWGIHMGSYDPYIKDQQRQAAADGAPLDATFRDHDTQEWNTLRTITSEITLARLASQYADDKAVLAEIVAVQESLA